MRSIIALILSVQTAAACEALVCQVSPDALALTQVITFDDQPAGWGPGILVDGVLELPGAVFGERFAGQNLSFDQGYDTISGPALPPLTLMAGEPGQTMSLVRMGGSARTVLNGFGPAAFPSREGQGEGAISVLFDRDQPALAFDIRGGEGGAAQVMFLRRDGTVLGAIPVAPVGEFAVGFRRNDGTPDIAGFVLTNSDVQGLAIDNLRFGPPPELG